MRQKTKKKPRLTPIERFNDAEQRGDLIDFVRNLHDNPLHLSYSSAQKRLLAIIEKRLKTDRAGLLADLLDNSLGITSWCVLRMNQLVVACLEQQDQAIGHQSKGQPSAIVLDVLLPKVLELNRQILEIEQTRVGLERQRELARAKKLENDRFVKTVLVHPNDQAPATGPSPKTMEPTGSNGKADSRSHPWLAAAS